MSYRHCFVSMCPNNSKRHPKKVFIHVPFDETRRKRWFKLARRSYDELSLKSHQFICEDHFDLEHDMQNYRRWKLHGCRIMMKTTAVPHKFDGLPNRNKEYSIGPGLVNLSETVPMKRMPNEGEQSTELGSKLDFIELLAPSTTSAANSMPHAELAATKELTGKFKKPDPTYLKKEEMCIAVKTEEINRHLAVIKEFNGDANEFTETSLVLNSSSVCEAVENSDKIKNRESDDDTKFINEFIDCSILESKQLETIMNKPKIDLEEIVDPLDDPLDCPEDVKDLLDISDTQIQCTNMDITNLKYPTPNECAVFGEYISNHMQQLPLNLAFELQEGIQALVMKTRLKYIRNYPSEASTVVKQEKEKIIIMAEHSSPGSSDPVKNTTDPMDVEEAPNESGRSTSCQKNNVEKQKGQRERPLNITTLKSDKGSRGGRRGLLGIQKRRSRQIFNFYGRCSVTINNIQHKK